MVFTFTIYFLLPFLSFGLLSDVGSFLTVMDVSHPTYLPACDGIESVSSIEPTLPNTAGLGVIVTGRSPKSLKTATTSASVICSVSIGTPKGLPAS